MRNNEIRITGAARSQICTRKLMTFLTLFSQKTLTHLSLGEIPSINDDVISVLARQLPNLVYLNLKNCISLSNESLVQVAHKSSKLETLNLDGDYNIGDAAIEELCKFCTELKTLDLSGLKYV